MALFRHFPERRNHETNQFPKAVAHNQRKEPTHGLVRVPCTHNFTLQK